MKQHSSNGTHRLARKFPAIAAALLGLSSGACLLTAQEDAPAQDVFELDTLEVRAISDGQRRALFEQRDSANLINVVSADAMGRFPDPNIAEALQRLPGIGIERDQGEGRFINVRGAPKEFASITVDGINIPASDPLTRGVALDIFSSDFANQIEVTKAIRPDQDADAIAGNVNVSSPSALEIGQRRILGSLAASYNDMGGTNDSRGSLFFSDVFGDKNQFGLVLGVNYSKTRREVDNIEHWDWDTTTLNSGQEIWIFPQTNFKDYETRRERLGFNAALEFRPNDNTYFFVRGFTSKFEDDEYRYRLSIVWEDGTLDQAASGDGFAKYTNPRVSYQFRHRIKTNETQAISAGGVHQFNGLRWDYTIASSRAKEYYPRRDELLYRKRVSTISYDFRADPKLPEISLFSTNEHLDTDNYEFREYARRTGDSEENELTASTNLRMESELFNNPARYRVGLKLRDRDKESDAERYRDRRSTANPGVPLTAFLSDKTAKNYNYLLGRKHQPSLVKEYFDSVRPNAPVRAPADAVLADYQVEERITAAYAMSEFTAGGIDFIAGVRMENTRTEALAYTYNAKTGDIGTTTAKESYTSWFPGIHLRYSLADDLFLRGSYTRAISRPSFSSLAPTTNEDPDARNISLGNPELRPTMADNFDLSLEYYLNNSGVISAAVFYKDLKNFIFTSRYTDTFIRDGQSVSYVVTQPLNSPDGEIYGFELNYQQTLSFLPAPFDGFGVFANYSFSKSSADLPDGSASIRLPGNSRHTSNIGIYYETDRLSLQLSYNNRSNYIQEVDSLNGRDYDLWWAGRSQVDLTASYQVARHFELYAQFNNITNTKGLRYVGSKERTLEYEEFGWWVTFGTKVSF